MKKKEKVSRRDNTPVAGRRKAPTERAGPRSRHPTRAQNVFNAFRRRYFDDSLPYFRVRKDFKGGKSDYCDVNDSVIHLSVDEDDVEAAVLHEMVHIVTGGAHDDAFRTELRRIADCGERAAIRELKLEEWHAATERVGARLAEEWPRATAMEAHQQIKKAVGPAPGAVPGAYRLCVVLSVRVPIEAVVGRRPSTAQAGAHEPAAGASRTRPGA
jgi:hypothetical protein